MMISTQQLPSTIGQRTWPRLGGAIYGFAAMLLGAVGLAFGDFAGVWQPVPPGMPGHAVLAYIVAVCFLVAGAAIQRHRFARGGVIVLGALYLTFAFLWLPRIIWHPHIYGTWGGFFEQFSFVPAALALYGGLDKSGGQSGLAETARVLFGICVVSFALNHFFAIPETAAMIPNWIPPGQQFWAITTGVAHLLAALTILSKVLDVLAARLLTLMLMLFGALVWLPMLVNRPGEHFRYAGSAITFVAASSAWVMAGSLAVRRLQETKPPQSRPKHRDFR